MIVNAIAVITNYSVNYPREIFNFFHKEKISFSASQCTADANDPLSNRELAVAPFEYSSFLLKLLDLWLESGDTKFKIDPVADFVSAVMGQTPRSCIFNGSCEKFVTVDLNGDLYPCDQYRSSNNLWGNLVISDYDDVVESNAHKDYSENRRKTLLSCKDCKWINVCHGWCRKTWGNSSVESLESHPNCRANRSLFESVSKKLAELGYEPIL